MESIGVESRSSHAILALYTMSFLTRSAFGVFGVVVPLYMRDAGVSFIGLGAAFSVFGIVMGIAGMFFGAHSDVVGRKPYLVLSLVLSSVVNLLYTQAASVNDFIILQALRGVSSSLNGTIVPALMADLTKESERGRKFGRLGGIGWVGTGVGYFLGGAISQIFDYNSSFIFVFILTLISCFLVIGLIPSYQLASRGPLKFGLIKSISPNLKVWLIITFITSLVIGPVEVMVLPAYSVTPGPLGVDKIVFGTFMSISYIMVSSSQFIGGSLADRYSRRKLSSLFFLFSAPFIAVQPLSLSFTYFATLYLLEGIGEGFSHPPRDALTVSSLRAEHKGLEFSILRLFGNIGSTIGFLAIGYILENSGFALPFFIRALIYVAAAGLIYFKLKD